MGQPPLPAVVATVVFGGSYVDGATQGPLPFGVALLGPLQGCLLRQRLQCLLQIRRGEAGGSTAVRHRHH